MAQTAKKSKSKLKSKPRLKSKKSKLPKRATRSKAKKVKKITKKSKKRVAKRVTKKATKKPVRKIAKARAAVKSLPVAQVTTTEIVATPRVGAGDLAPTFSLIDQSGQTVSLESFRGKKVVVYFYPKDDTPGCTKEACSFRDHTADFTGLDAVILGISFDDQASHQKFIEKYQLNFPLLVDANKDVANAYGVYVQKNMYGNLVWGIERSTFVIDREGKIAAAFRKVSVDGHTEEVLNALRAIA